jgi:hypothetical protein
MRYTNSLASRLTVLYTAKEPRWLRTLAAGPGLTVVAPWPASIWMRHSCRGRWHLGDDPVPEGYVRQVVMLYPILVDIYRRGDRPRTLDLSRVSYKALADEQTSRPRYAYADTAFPMLAAEGAPNPDGKPFRLLDGRHRLHKLVITGATTGSFYIVPYSEIMPWIGYDNKPESQRGQY